MNDAEAAEVLERAADILETRGWVQGSWTRRKDDGEMGFCSIGAIRVVLGTNHLDAKREHFDEIQVIEALARHIPEAAAAERPHQRPCIVAWNDLRGQTQDNVVDTFKLAAKDLRNES